MNKYLKGLIVIFFVLSVASLFNNFYLAGRIEALNIKNEALNMRLNACKHISQNENLEGWKAEREVTPIASDSTGTTYESKPKKSEDTNPKVGQHCIWGLIDGTALEVRVDKILPGDFAKVTIILPDGYAKDPHQIAGFQYIQSCWKAGRE